jgi:membrane-bound lytic murein transglycosylase A
MLRSYVSAFALILLGACARQPEPACPCPPPAKPPETVRYEAASFAALPGWANATLEPSLRAFLAGCPRLQASPLAAACEMARSLPGWDEAAARRFFESGFVPYALVSSEGRNTGLITGYYEPVLEGSRARTERHRYPVFGVPSDLVVVDLAGLHPELRHLRLRGRIEGRRLVPYYSRADISSRGEDFAAPVLAWTSDPVELFFLQIQGSGQIRVENGERMRVGYADQNGHPYRALGRYLVDRGELTLEEASMQGIKAWAAANREKLDVALGSNPSYVFFRELPPEGGPIGALGVPLTAGYSLAVDRRFVPLGAPVFLASTFPGSDLPLERLMAAQDTGGAIRGAVRGDFFWGSGPEAGELAGTMREQGRIWLLWPRGARLPQAS